MGILGWRCDRVREQISHSTPRKKKWKLEMNSCALCLEHSSQSQKTLHLAMLAGTLSSASLSSEAVEVDHEPFRAWISVSESILRQFNRYIGVVLLLFFFLCFVRIMSHTHFPLIWEPLGRRPIF